jgi:hypothetical protein
METNLNESLSSFESNNNNDIQVQKQVNADIEDNKPLINEISTTTKLPITTAFIVDTLVTEQIFATLSSAEEQNSLNLNDNNHHTSDNEINIISGVGNSNDSILNACSLCKNNATCMINEEAEELVCM